MLEFLGKLCLAPCCSCFHSPVVRDDMSYVFFTKEKLDRVESAMKDIIARKTDIEKKLDLPQNKGKQPTNQILRWLKKVAEKEKMVTQLLDEYSQSCCVAGPCCLNCFSRYNISRSAINLLDEITQLKGEQTEVSFIEQQPPKAVLESYKIVGKKIISYLDIACGYIKDETVSMIGIWGMGGVGKSTLLKKIKHSLLGDTNILFDHVLYIEASKGIQLEELQRKVAQSLHLGSSASKEDILNVLKTNNFVLLLDNIWEELDIINVGVPHPYNDDNSPRQYKHKVIFTTRSEDVCALMGVNKRIKMECLEPDEAWDLFKDTVNLDAIEADEKFKQIARQVMNKCGGLPLALKVIGKALSNRKTVKEWEFILSSLQNSATGVVQGVEEALFPILKISYDNLPTSNIQECFLCASLLRRAYKYELLECWMGLGLIGDFANLRQAYGEAEHILHTLEESCLLGVYKNNDLGLDDLLVLHDVIYEMALWIASDRGVNKNTENWRFANQVITSGDIKFLPILSRQRSDLLSLMRVNSFSLQKIPKGFFREVPNLTYLDLSRCGIKELPKDIKYLVNLQYLNISFTHISSLPKELVHLNKLQYLLCRDTRLRKVENGLMSRLQKLKVLDIYPCGWVEPAALKTLKKHIKAIGMNVVSQEAFDELSCLPTTRLCVQTVDNLASLSFDTLSCKNHGFLQELEIRSCPQLEVVVMNGSETHLENLTIYDVEKLQNIRWPDLSPPQFFHMLKTLCIYRCNLANFAWVLHLPCLFELKIEDCAEIETLFYVEEERQIQKQVLECPVAFPRLERLELTKLPKLVIISNFALDCPQLSWLSVEECLNLKKLPFGHGINSNKRIVGIYCKREWWESLEWDDTTIPSHLRPFHYVYQDDNPNACTIS